MESEDVTTVLELIATFAVVERNCEQAFEDMKKCFIDKNEVVETELTEILSKLSLAHGSITLLAEITVKWKEESFGQSEG